MKNFILICFFMVVVALAFGEEMYTTKYDDMDVDAIIQSKRMKEGYINCFLDKGKCTPAGEEAKSKLQQIWFLQYNSDT